MHFAGIWWSNISEICVSRCVFFLKLFSDVPHFSRTKLGCTSPNKAARPQFCSLRASKLHVPKKSKHPRYEDIPWRCMDYVCIYFQLFLYHKFGSIESLIK